MSDRHKAPCSLCRRVVTVKNDGNVRQHHAAGTSFPCDGAHKAPRARVPLACLQGRHTDTCGHLEPEPDGLQLALEHHNHTFTKDGPDLSRCACGTTINRAGRGRPTLEREDTDPHTWPDALIDTWHTAPTDIRATLKTAARFHDEQTVTEARTATPSPPADIPGLVTLTDDESRQIIAGHLELHPAAALRTVQKILAERLAP